MALLRLIGTFGSHSLHLHLRALRWAAPASFRPGRALLSGTASRYQSAQYPLGYHIRNRYYNRWLSPLSTTFFPKFFRIFHSQAPCLPSLSRRSPPRVEIRTLTGIPQALCAQRLSPLFPVGRPNPRIDANRPVCAFFSAAVPAPTGALLRLTAFEALFHRLLWIFSLCPNPFCAIMATSYDRVLLRFFEALRGLSSAPGSPAREKRL